MFHKLLIANRGEIACRIIRSARSLGIRTVAVYSDADSDALHVNMADEAVHIGGSPSKESYLKMDTILEVATQVGADAIHPGYGFLSENSKFSQQCEDHQIVFVGPPVAAIDAMGSKSAAKQIMEAAKVPLVPGYHGDNQDAEFLKKEAAKIGYPVLLKAAAGGGGKGMRQVWKESEFDDALAAAKRESLSSFGDDHMLVEKYLLEPRHVEIQIFCDKHGNSVYLFERDCSVQRRHQKVIEEAPAPGMTNELRAQMGEAAIRAAEAIHYEGAGTVEFLLDANGDFYFMEMNTRLQVEHPVTEMITKQDLVEWQLRVAAGENLPLSQEDIPLIGHSFEARVYAEDPENDFLPATGRLNFLSPPLESEFVRVDTGVRQGDEVSVFYDPMIAKLIVWDENRDKALRRMSKALSEYKISGLTTNIDFLYNLATCPAFKQGKVHTGFIEQHNDDIFHSSHQEIEKDLPLAALYLTLEQEQRAAARSQQTSDPWSPWNNSSAWRLNEPHLHELELVFHDAHHKVTVETINKLGTRYYQVTTANRTVECMGSLEGGRLIANVDGHRITATFSEHDGEFSLYSQYSALHFKRHQHAYENDEADTGGGLVAPMNGTMVAHLVEAGEDVSKDQPLMVMEAMKMEHTIKAPADGKVTSFYYQPGDLVDGGSELLAFEVNE